MIKLCESNIPIFLLSAPFGLNSDNPNNIWMQELDEESRKIDNVKAVNQWMDLYEFLAGDGLVYVLPTTYGLQDQVYTANLGIVLPHTKNKQYVLANFKSPPRRGEPKAAYKFLKMLGLDIVQAPKYFEGEADLKYLRDNVYIGAFGIRTSYEALEWFSKEYDMNVIPFAMEDEYLYHLDCCVFPLSTEKVIMCTELAHPKTIKNIEKYAEIIDVDIDDAYNGICNSVRSGSCVMSASNLLELSVHDDNYEGEKHKVDTLTKICAKHGFEPVLFDLSEFTKSGAMLSCLVNKLNYCDYKITNV